MARLRPRIGKSMAGNGYELPIEARLMQCQLDHTIGRRVLNQAVWSESTIESKVAGPACACYDLDDASRWVQVSGRILRGEALVVVSVTVYDQVHIITI